MTSTKCFVGIDPAFRENGFTICIIDEDKTARFERFKGFFEFISWLWDAPFNAVFCIENSNLQDVTFDMTGSKGVVAKKSRSVGKNQAISQATVDFCRKFAGDENVIEVSPLQKGEKVGKELFLMIVERDGVKLLNYKNIKDQQDERDAYMLARGAMKNIFKNLKKKL